jgi:hypothetical protein
MEYVRQRGSFSDLPYELIADAYRDTYPDAFREGLMTIPEGDFHCEAGQENQPAD